MDSKGSVLILLVIVLALLSVLATTLVNVVYTNYTIRSLNIESKRAFYLSENELNESYVVAKKLIDEAIEDSIEKAEDYIFEYPSNSEEAEIIFANNYKQYIAVNIRNRISDCNPSVEVRNGGLVFVDETLNVLLRSTYARENNVVKITWLELIIGVPNYDNVKNGSYELEDYIKFGNWRS